MRQWEATNGKSVTLSSFLMRPFANNFLCDSISEFYVCEKCQNESVHKWGDLSRKIKFVERIIKIYDLRKILLAENFFFAFFSHFDWKVIFLLPCSVVGKIWKFKKVFPFLVHLPTSHAYHHLCFYHSHFPSSSSLFFYLNVSRKNEREKNCVDLSYSQGISHLNYLIFNAFKFIK